MNQLKKDFVFVTIRFTIDEYMAMIKKLHLDESKSEFIRDAIREHRKGEKQNEKTTKQI